jgi:hypothetical protein
MADLGSVSTQFQPVKIKPLGIAHPIPVTDPGYAQDQWADAVPVVTIINLDDIAHLEHGHRQPLANQGRSGWARELNPPRPATSARRGQNGLDRLKPRHGTPTGPEWHANLWDTSLWIMPYCL